VIILKVKGVNHIGIAVKSLEKALKNLNELFGLKADKILELEQFKVKLVFVPLNDVSLELIEPTSPDSDVAHFLREKGEGLHHITLEVENLKEAMEELKKKGVKLLSEKPLQGVGGIITFVKPEHANNILIELMEKTS
jgi:methylmalonyl-CoA epimerase